MATQKSNVLDVGFDWNEEPSSPSEPMVLTYGFAGDDGKSQDIFSVPKGSRFTFTAFDVSKTPGVAISELDVTLDKVKGDHGSPFAAFSGGRLGTEAPDPDGRSAGLNARGTGWGTAWQQVTHQGTWRITVRVTATCDGTTKTWQADPELIVGGKGSGNGG